VVEANESRACTRKGGREQCEVFGEFGGRDTMVVVVVEGTRAGDSGLWSEGGGSVFWDEGGGGRAASWRRTDRG
jgi:hypothetical protein